MLKCTCVLVHILKHTLASRMNRPPRVFTCSMLVFFSIIFMYIFCKEKAYALMNLKNKDKFKPCKKNMFYSLGHSSLSIVILKYKTGTLVIHSLIAERGGFKDTRRGLWVGLLVCGSISGYELVLKGNTVVETEKCPVLFLYCTENLPFSKLHQI